MTNDSLHVCELENAPCQLNDVQSKVNYSNPSMTIDTCIQYGALQICVGAGRKRSLVFQLDGERIIGRQVGKSQLVR